MSRPIFTGVVGNERITMRIGSSETTLTPYQLRLILDAVTLNVPFVAAYTPDSSLGHANFGALTANTTIAADTSSGLAPVRGQMMTFNFVQDGTGGRTITWNAAWKGATLTASGTANQKAMVRFMYDGANWVQVTSTGWYS